MKGKCLRCNRILEAKNREELDNQFSNHNESKHTKFLRRKRTLIMQIVEEAN